MIKGVVKIVVVFGMESVGTQSKFFFDVSLERFCFCNRKAVRSGFVFFGIPTEPLAVCVICRRLVMRSAAQMAGEREEPIAM